ncbi:hypothetical protein MPSEU_000572300 [Mayamaea pseudoterrestris]|nr:hypothetical protein MPSEU_000572300 [Mayamaea pseudoterrestris]
MSNPAFNTPRPPPDKDLKASAEPNTGIPRTATATTTTTTTTTNEPSSWALPLFLVVLASSAGFTMYTKKTGSMLNTWEKVNQNVLRNHPPKYGPPTKDQYEKLRPRIDKDEFF